MLIYLKIKNYLKYSIILKRNIVYHLKDKKSILNLTVVVPLSQS